MLALYSTLSTVIPITPLADIIVEYLDIFCKLCYDHTIYEFDKCILSNLAYTNEDDIKNLGTLVIQIHSLNKITYKNSILNKELNTLTQPSNYYSFNSRYLICPICHYKDITYHNLLDDNTYLTRGIHCSLCSFTIAYIHKLHSIKYTSSSYIFQMKMLIWLRKKCESVKD